jgi:hypothetical protein
MTGIPEHLKDLASWVCKKCTNTTLKPKVPVKTKREKQGKTGDEFYVKEETNGIRPRVKRKGFVVTQTK